MAAPLAGVTAILREVLRAHDLDVAPTSRFDDLSGWDSMDLIALVVEVQCRFELCFETTEIEGMTTVGDLLRMIAAKQALASV